MKIVINNCFGGFSLSKKAIELYAAAKGIELGEWNKYGFKNFGDSKIDRNDPMLVQVVKQLGRAANGCGASLKVVKIPDDVEWQIEEYDGKEHIAEKHRIWY